MRSWVSLPLIIVLSGSLGSCAIAPAKVERAIRSPLISLRPQETASLHELLTTALTEDPASAKSSRALGQFVERWKRENQPAQGEVKEEGLPSYRVRFEGSPAAPEPLDYFDEIHAASSFKVKRIRHHQRTGIGAPLLALRENRHRERVEKYFPPEVISRPMTATLEAGAVRQGTRSVRIRLLCSLQNETVVHQGKSQPLAADFSMPWASALSRAGRLQQSAILDMLTRTPRRQPQLYLMEPYDPEKEPLIMIHGLLSTPLAWAQISNDLWGDETVRRRYQIWHYLYNTSAPALYSARILRGQLRELRFLLDPEGDDPASQKATLLTHSMGGLIGKGLVVTPGDAFWKAAFKVPPEELKLTAEDRTVLNDAFNWQGDRSIRRILFICTPHRGSAFADNPAGRIGSWLTRPPSQFQDFFKRVSAENPDVFTPAYTALGQGRLDSVSALSPRQPTLRILAGLPIPKRVKTHSIIGNRGRDGPLENSSDGIVPYASSHLDGADSELVVPTGHGAFHHPAAMAEILRVLRLP
ncbi:pimeloyl-ACP methyl ester carboxylesterase [Prosthecobacter fusiformis]|uniref:Pimeloyl-ACP methyl ester carboxylesterase n=1 Tax=Prosthecobacter fusiformis TaxID=48464 RepID=A0A4R7SPD1_9BACT|nr:alpha/beta hydrolase [Prosthecobacter fusiformis]TDU80851.1 pimeloyl-ACP methyl ester carboxylesterase [Prosthecobacter fusiformis]